MPSVKTMNVIWIVSDTLRRDHIGAYGNSVIRTPAMDALAAKGVRFDRHYAGGFPTMPTRADHATGRWTMSFMGWEPLPDGVETAAQVLSSNGYHTAAMVDTPFYIREGMNYDRGFQTFVRYAGQDGPGSSVPVRIHESVDEREAWRHESDRNAPRTFSNAMQWLERHHKEDFFLYVDTWDPHEPWDAPAYYTELYMPGYDGEIVNPVYGHIRHAPGVTEADVRKAHATYMGEITMVDTWLGFFLRRVENMGLMDETAIIFTSDHGFYFGEHGGMFGKLVFDKKADGTLPPQGAPGVSWDRSPLYEEVVHIPLLVYVPGVESGAYDGLTSVVDVMPTVLDFLGVDVPEWVDGRSLLPAMRDRSVAGRDFVVSTIPFVNPGDPVRSFDDIRRMVRAPLVTTVTADRWSLLYSTDEGMSELFDIVSDPAQESDVIGSNPETAGELHKRLLAFMAETGASRHLIESRRDLPV